MKKILVLFAVLLSVLSSYAQKKEYKVLATCFRDMKTQDYGKLTMADYSIVKEGNSVVNINGKKFNVISVDREIKTDSINSVQYTANDEEGKEYVIKFNHDLFAKVELMENVVIIFESMRPYDWTYYFTKEKVVNKRKDGFTLLNK